MSRKALVASTVVLVVLACSGPSTGSRPTPAIGASGTSATPRPDARPASGGCGRSTVYQGRVPGWLEVAAGHNVPTGVPYVVATPDLAAGFIFGYPLRAGHPQNPSNKILWAVRTPRAGSTLQVDGHPLGASQPVVHESQPANSGPGEIYPDGVDVPTPGCWRLTLQWANGRAEVDLDYLR